jgi:hypothetical protein
MRTASEHTWAFLQGFADGTGTTISVAESCWEAQCKKLHLSPEKQKEIEDKGYSAGQIEGARWEQEERP